MRVNNRGIPNAEIVNRTINVCNFFAAIKSDGVTKRIAQNMAQWGHMPTSCPVKKGNYFLRNASINGDIFPPYLPELKAVVHMTYFMEEHRKLEEIAAYHYYVEVIERTSKKRFNATKHWNERTNNCSEMTKKKLGKKLWFLFPSDQFLNFYFYSIENKQKRFFWMVWILFLIFNNLQQANNVNK